MTYRWAVTTPSTPNRESQPTASEAGPVEHIRAWRCIGCGKIEAPQPCIGICQDVAISLVDADAYDDTEALARGVRCEVAELSTLVRRLAFTTPRDGEWERSYRALQDQARGLLHRAG